MTTWGSLGKPILWTAVAVLLLATLGVGCAESDPARDILNTRRQWKVDLAGFVQREDGAVSAQFRLSGPVNSDLADLTVKVELLDGADAILLSTWKSFDLRDVQRGGPVEAFLTIDSPGEGMVVESIRLDPVHYPEPGDFAHILELDMLAPAAE